jgi:glycine/D-amino acid oxidase-like deaminating enzyme
MAIEIGGERITPGHIVIATNAWINALLPDAPPLSSCLTFACATAPLDRAALAAIGLEKGHPVLYDGHAVPMGPHKFRWAGDFRRGVSFRRAG